MATYFKENPSDEPVLIRKTLSPGETPVPSIVKEKKSVKSSTAKSPKPKDDEVKNNGGN